MAICPECGENTYNYLECEECGYFNEEPSIFNAIDVLRYLGLPSARQQTVMNFFVLNEEDFDSEMLVRFLEGMLEVLNDYADPWAKEQYGTNAFGILESDREEFWDTMPKEFRRNIRDIWTNIAKELDIAIRQEYDELFYYSLGHSRLVTIHYQTEYGTAPQSVEILANTPITADALPQLTAEGYTHTGWVDYIGDRVEVGSVFGYSPILTAIWEEAPTTVDYTISYETAHGIAPSAKTVTVNESESYTLTETDLPVLTAEGYLFGGWSVDGVIISAGYEISANITLTAVWVGDMPVSQIDPQSMLIGWLVGKKIAAMRGKV